ncbi:MAG: hypothetical protein HN341_14825 [Verrucomicrobia bacterium]|jgi:hypothetical protein|nr:hypothetical protein [Verrucomicrobiota bacterium]
MHPVVRSCLLIAIELAVLLGAGVIASLRGRRLLSVALFIMALSPLFSISLEIITNTYRPLPVPDLAYVLRVPFYIRALGCIVLLSAVNKLSNASAD